MSFGSALSTSLRALVIAAATGAAVLGLLAVLHPFAAPASPATVSIDGSSADALHARIDAARRKLTETEAALDNVNGQSLSIAAPDAGDARAQYEAQIAAATERRDLAIRHAQAIRDGLEAGGMVSSLADIRDSVVIGQLLAQQAALDATIAEQGARLKASHPTMRALLAQKKALAGQIDSEAASIASALEAEARLDDAQIRLLQGQLGSAPAVDAGSAPSSLPALQAQAAAQRAELDGLMDAYFNLRPGTAGSNTAPVAGLLSPLNLLVIGVAFLAAIVFQIALSVRRRGARRTAADLQRWRDDHDPEIAVPAVPVSQEDPALRRAS